MNRIMKKRVDKMNDKGIKKGFLQSEMNINISIPHILFYIF